MLHQLLQYDPSTWKELVRWLGVPGAMMAVFVMSLVKGHFITKREADRRDSDWRAREEQLVKAYDARLKVHGEHCVSENRVWAERFEELKRESVERLTSLRTEKDMWRDTALKATHIADKAVKG